MTIICVLMVIGLICIVVCFIFATKGEPSLTYAFAGIGFAIIIIAYISSQIYIYQEQKEQEKITDETIQKAETLAEEANYAVYLDGITVSIDSIDLSDYKIEIDNKNKQIILIH